MSVPVIKVANSATTAHPSVRLKGTENEFDVIQCTDSRCPVNKSQHMHCPFCVKTESYLDARILKAHYRVKHVDKGLEFVGLKILRCCLHCEIVGSIKGEKKFRTPHWHCYKCKNGFNRRDEAFKHYKTHFKMPHSTYQINITQDLFYNDSKVGGDASQDCVSSTTSKPAFSTIILNSHSNLSEVEEPASSTTAESIYSHPEEHAAIMIIQDDGEEAGSSSGILSIDPSNISEAQETVLVSCRVLKQLHDQMEKLKDDKEKLQDENRALRMQLKRKSDGSMCNSRHINLGESANAYEEKFQTLMNNFQHQQKELFRQQLSQVKKEAYTIALNELQNGIASGNLKLQNSPVVALLIDNDSSEFNEDWNQEEVLSNK